MSFKAASGANRAAKVFLMLAVMACCSIHANAQFFKKLNDMLDVKITINVTPDNAKISIGGTEVATGTYLLNLKDKDHEMVKLSLPGYVEKTVKVSKTDKNVMSYTLEQDDAWEASEVSVDLANKPMRITVNKGMESDETWRRLMFYISETFPNMETTDRTVGWIRSAWNIQNFNHETIRTCVELKEVPGQDVKTIRLTLYSQTAKRTCGLTDTCFNPWDRTLKAYIQFVDDLTNVLKSL